MYEACTKNQNIHLNRNDKTFFCVEWLSNAICFYKQTCLTPLQVQTGQKKNVDIIIGLQYWNFIRLLYLILLL